jgi:hypothetical protein
MARGMNASETGAKLPGQNHFAEPNRHVLTSLHPILICKVAYILSTGGVALRMINSQHTKLGPHGG